MITVKISLPVHTCKYCLAAARSRPRHISCTHTSSTAATTRARSHAFDEQMTTQPDQGIAGRRFPANVIGSSDSGARKALLANSSSGACKAALTLPRSIAGSAIVQPAQHHEDPRIIIEVIRSSADVCMCLCLSFSARRSQWRITAYANYDTA